MELIDIEDLDNQFPNNLTQVDDYYKLVMEPNYKCSVYYDNKFILDLWTLNIYDNMKYSIFLVNKDNIKDIIKLEGKKILIQKY